MGTPQRCARHRFSLAVQRRRIRQPLPKRNSFAVAALIGATVTRTAITVPASVFIVLFINLSPCLNVCPSDTTLWYFRPRCWWFFAGVYCVALRAFAVIVAGVKRAE